MSDLYDTDILEWSEQQAALLRRVAAADRANHGAPDWPNIVEEIESVGRSQLSAVRSLLTQALVQTLQVQAWPNSTGVPGVFAPSMRQHIDVAKLYARALCIMPETIDGLPPLPVPQTCAVTLDELLADEPEH